MTELKSALRREVKIGAVSYRLTIDPQGFQLVLKGRRKGLEIAWHDLVSGDAAMAVALRASLTAPTAKQRPTRARPVPSRPSARSKTAR